MVEVIDHTVDCTKVCTKCQVEKLATVEFFNKHKLCLYGLNSVCKDCQKIYNKHYKDNHDTIRVKQAEYFLENRETILKNNKIYREKNKEELAEHSRIYRKENADKIKQQRKEYRIRNGAVIKKEATEGNKICTKCNQEKPATAEFFNRHKTSKGGLTSNCKDCTKASGKKFYEENREKVLAQQKEYYLKNTDKILPRAKDYREKHKEKVNNYSKEYHARNSETIKVKRKKYRQENMPRIVKQMAEKRKSSIHHRIAHNLRSRLRFALKGLVKAAATFELIGCTADELKIYIENKFTEGMSWETYGNPNGDHSFCWHIDHIKPCASFDLTDPEQQRQCFHYTNLQPLWAEDNFSKWAHYDEKNDIK